MPTPLQGGFAGLRHRYALYSGAPGCGKTQALAFAAGVHARHPDYRALIVAQTDEALGRTNGMRDALAAAYPEAPIDDDAMRFVSGAQIDFATLPDSEAHERKLRGRSYHFVGVDEAGDIEPRQLAWLMRLARMKDALIPAEYRLTASPGGVAHEWLMDHFAYAADSDRYFLHIETDYLIEQRKD